MNTEFQKAVLPRELRSLMAFDRQIFPKADLFTAADWKECDSYWMLVDNRKVGCCAFVADTDFQEDIDPARGNPHREGTLYIVTTGILPRFQGMGFGELMKSWEVAYARFHGFKRIVTNTRKGNAAMIALNRKYKFRAIRTTPRYYSEPTDSTVVMELRLPARRTRSKK